MSKNFWSITYAIPGYWISAIPAAMTMFPCVVIHRFWIAAKTTTLADDKIQLNPHVINAREVLVHEAGFGN
jgi:hypothetical protein